MSSNVTFLIVAAFFSFSLSIANACSCMPSHPQDKFCYADFVVLARVKREQVVNGTRIYKIRIRKEYKMSEKSYVALKSGRLLTAEEDSMCGIRLQVGKMYAISGKVVSLQARVNLCGLIQRWETLTPRQRKGLRKSYQQGCTCQIKPCRLPHCRKTRDSCSWSTFRYGHHNDCLYQEGTCLRSVSKQCVWSKNVVQSGCLRKARPKQHHHLPFLDGPDRKFGQ